MHKYAVVDSAGLVIQTIESPNRYIEITDKSGLPASPGLVHRSDGRFVSAPKVTLSLNGASVGCEVISGQPFTPDFALPADWPEAPRKLMLQVNSNETPERWAPGMAITFTVPGEYQLHVIGPAPWRSNKLKLTVVEGDARHGK